jgi:hypothetical protein
MPLESARILPRGGRKLIDVAAVVVIVAAVAAILRGFAPREAPFFLPILGILGGNRRGKRVRGSADRPADARRWRTGA